MNVTKTLNSSGLNENVLVKMMRFSLLFLLLLLQISAFAQVVDRYPYVQQPTETSVLIAWNTAISGVGTLSWGTGPSALTNTLNDVSATQKHALTITGLQPNTQYFYMLIGNFASSF
jgi:hypothetical protein